MFSCKHEPDDINPGDPNNPGDTTGLITCDPDTAYFKNDVMPIFQSHCAECHNETTSEHGLILTSYSNIINSDHIEVGNASESDIYEAITDTDPEDRMPFGRPPLSATEIATIRDWINQGARNNYCDSGCDTTVFTFAEAIEPMIDLNCKGCHNASVANDGVRLDTYEFIAEVAQNGRLMGAITHADGYAKMPYLGDKLSDCQITQVRKWIESEFNK